MGPRSFNRGKFFLWLCLFYRLLLQWGLGLSTEERMQWS